MKLEDLREGKMFLIDKPLDWTSFDVVKKIKWNIRNAYNLKKFKVGHAGTLDPKATGLLIVCVGKFTKKINEYQGLPKTYTGTLKLGATTECFDTEMPEDKQYATSHITNDLIHSTTEDFIGTINQHPPVHSAIKKQGQRLYELARQGIAIKTEPRQVTIHRFTIVDISMPFVKFEVECEKGTYIRSLANDFGKALKSGAYLTELRRTKIGEFSVDNSTNEVLESSYFEQKED